MTALRCCINVMMRACIDSVCPVKASTVSRRSHFLSSKQSTG
jgi:hypothetical protein